MGALIAGVVVLALLLLVSQGFVAADAKALARALRIVAAGLVGLLAIGLALSGRLAFALLAAGAAAVILTGKPLSWPRGPGWPGGGGGSGRPGRSQMSRAEALKVLGLEDGASADDIRAAHRRLIMQSHPDKGGSSYLAAKINEAKDVLLGGRK